MMLFAETRQTCSCLWKEPWQWEGWEGPHKAENCRSSHCYDSDSQIFRAQRNFYLVKWLSCAAVDTHAGSLLVLSCTCWESAHAELHATSLLRFLIWISLLANDVTHPFMSIGYLSSLDKCLAKNQIYRQKISEEEKKRLVQPEVPGV